MVHKNQHIELIVKSLVAETPHYLSITFHRPKGFSYESGDWIDIQPVDQQLAGGMTYSLSSAPSESDLMITFREGLSPLKRHMAAVHPGDTFIISQYGNDYGFRLRNNKSSVLIAGGVGIAPFRSMLKELYEQKLKNEVQLIYLNKDDTFLFQDELNTWSDSSPHITIHYISTDNTNRKKREKHIVSLLKNVGQQFYIAGPPTMVAGHMTLLEEIGISSKSIATDIFGGY